MKYKDWEYLSLDLFAGDESELTLHTKKLVKTRKSHPCYYGVLDKTEHQINAGEVAVFEKALVDGEFFGRYYMCIACMDKELDQEGEDDE